MIEFCTKRRMVLSIVVLGILTVFILILEEALTTNLVTHNGQNATRLSSSSLSTSSQDSLASSSSRGQIFENHSKKFCWQNEEFKIVVPCSKCSPFEINTKIHDICELTGLKETVECTISGQVQRSCTQITSDEKRRFWIFQSLMLLFTVLGTSFIKYRRSHLERKSIRKIESRLAT